MSRISKIEYYANLCVQASLRSTCIRRRVGAVIVKNDRVLSMGYNGAPVGLANCCDHPERCYRSKHNIPSGQDLHLCFASHAEVNAIMEALKTGTNLEGASLFVNCFPCSNCAKTIIQSGISEVYYIDDYDNDFSKIMLNEAGVKLIKLDGSIYRTPVGTEVKTVNDLDAIDPLVGLIYKYTPGTKEFEENRFKVLEERNFFNKYNELIYYTTYKMNTEILNVYDAMGGNK
jgi:dCMP deaminase